MGIKLFDTDRSASDKLSYTVFNETYWDERERRKNGDLSVDQYQSWTGGELKTLDVETDIAEGHYGTDLFFEELFEIDTTGTISDFDDTTSNLKNVDEDLEFLFCQDWYDIAHKIADGDVLQGTAVTGGDEAADNLMNGDVRVSEIPPQLFKRGKAQERIDWINAKGDSAKKKRLAIIEATGDIRNSDGGEDA